MRRVLTLAVLATSCIALSGAYNHASAQPAVEIEWSTNGLGPVANPNVTAEIGDEVTATFYLEHVGGTIAGYTIEVTWDATEFSLVSSTEFLPPGFNINMINGTDNVGLCPGLMYEALAPVFSPVSGRFAIGEAVFEVIALANDSQADVTTGPCSDEAVFAIFASSGDVTALGSYQSGQVNGQQTTPSLGTGGLALLAILLALTVWWTARRRLAESS